MIDMFDFGDSPADALLDAAKKAGSLPASRLLTALDGESQTLLLEIFEQLEQENIPLILDEIPAFHADTETALRLRQEAKLISGGDMLQQLEETDPLRVYLQELSAIPVCGDLQMLTQGLLQGDPDACGRATELCLSRVVELAGQYAGKGVLLLDLIQEGSMALWQGFCQYTGEDIEQYRDQCIHRAMIKAIVIQAHAAGVGQRLRQALEDYRSVDERLLGELGRNPTLEEIAESMHISPAQVSVVADMLENARMLNRAKNPENTNTMPEEEDQAVEDTAYFQMRQRIADLLSGLSQQDARLLTLRYGLEGGVPLTPQQTGARLGLTSEEVITREAAALAKLRQ